MKNSFLIFLITVFAFSCGNVVTTKEDGSSDEEAEVSDKEKNDEVEDADHEIEDEDTQQTDEKQDVDEAEGFCGDNTVNGEEVCDGGSKLCSELGEGSGFASCKSDCSGWNTVNCEGGESECTGSESKCVGTEIYICQNEKWVLEEDCNDDGKICRAAKCITPGVDDPRIDSTGPDYDGDTILVFNTSHDGESSSFSGT